MSDHSTRSRWCALLCFTALSLALTAPALADIHAGDSLYVQVWNHPELSKQVIVDADGAVRVPLSGAVAVAGLDEGAAGAKLAQALRPYVVYPAVSVQVVAQGASIFVSGGLVGTLKYASGETLSAAISDAMTSVPEAQESLNAAGQSTTRIDGSSAADRARIDLTRVGLQRNGKPVGEFDALSFGVNGSAGPLVEPGDTIIFNYRPIAVRVAGAVAHPGLAYLSAEQSESEAIAQAGGLLPTSASNHIQLTRDAHTYSIALGDPMMTGSPHPGDLIAVPEAPRVNVVGTVVTPGVVALKTDPSLLSAMYSAGGPTKAANLKDVQVVHDGKVVAYDVTQLTHGNLTQNPTLQDGDTVVVPQGHQVDWSGIFGILGGIAAGLASRVPL